MGEDKILVISQPAEQSTDNVLKYLIYFNANFVRVNEDDIISSIEVSSGSLGLESKLFLDSFSINLANVSSVWYRRGKLNIDGLFPRHNKDGLYGQYLENSYKIEIDRVRSFLSSFLKKKRHINSFSDNFISKLVQLDIAMKNGLKTPKTIVTDSATRVLSFFDSGKIIYKAMNFNVFRLFDGQRMWSCGMESSVLVSKEVLEERVRNNERSFLLSMFQEYVEKKIEIRSFFLFGKFYSMAIFSQDNDIATVDWRDATFDNPNRISIFKLPEKLMKKLSDLMADLQLNSGSIDLIYTPTNEFVFLEVNPIGQFDWMTKLCNFFIEKKIANELRK